MHRNGTTSGSAAQRRPPPAIWRGCLRSPLCIDVFVLVGLHIRDWISRTSWPWPQCRAEEVVRRHRLRTSVMNVEVCGELQQLDGYMHSEGTIRRNFGPAGHQHQVAPRVASGKLNMVCPEQPRPERAISSDCLERNAALSRAECSLLCSPDRVRKAAFF